jgi:hypothetical protein
MDGHVHENYARRPGDDPPALRPCRCCGEPIDAHGQEMHAKVEMLETQWLKAKAEGLADPVLILALDPPSGPDKVELGIAERAEFCDHLRRLLGRPDDAWRLEDGPPPGLPMTVVVMDPQGTSIFNRPHP